MSCLLQREARSSRGTKSQTQRAKVDEALEWRSREKRCQATIHGVCLI